MKVFVKLFSALNLGDDLFLKILLERYPNVQFVVAAPIIYKEKFSDYTNLTVLEDSLNIKKSFIRKSLDVFKRNLFTKHYQNTLIKKIMSFFKNQKYDYKAFISIGGSIFMQPKKLTVYSDIEYYKLVNIFFNKTFFLGCNFGPFSDPLYIKSYRNIFCSATDVCFREKLSFNLFSELESVRYSPDIVFNLKFAEKIKVPNSVGFSIINARNKINTGKYLRKYVELIEYYQEKKYNIYLFSFCRKQGDEEIINSIFSLLKNKTNVHKVFYDGNIVSFLDVYSSVERMYCGRFHSIILSMLFNQKIYPIIYSKKMTNVLKDIDYRGNFVLIEDFFKLDPDFAFSKIEQNYYNIEREVQESCNQFKKLDLLLKSKL